MRQMVLVAQKGKWHMTPLPPTFDRSVFQRLLHTIPPNAKQILQERTGFPPHYMCAKAVKQKRPQCLWALHHFTQYMIPHTLSQYWQMCHHQQHNKNPYFDLNPITFHHLHCNASPAFSHLPGLADSAIAPQVRSLPSSQWCF